MTSGKDRWNKNVFRCRRNEYSDWADVTLWGRLFHTRGAATGKARLPTDDSLTCGTTRQSVLAERSTTRHIGNTNERSYMGRAKMNTVRQGFQKLPCDIQADRHDQNCIPRRFVGGPLALTWWFRTKLIRVVSEDINCGQEVDSRHHGMKSRIVARFLTAAAVQRCCVDRMCFRVEYIPTYTHRPMHSCSTRTLQNCGKVYGTL